MSTVQIGASSRRLEEADTHWVTEQVLSRRKAGENPCVRVSIERENVDLTLRTGNCPVQAGTSRQATPRERELMERWRQSHLDLVDYDVGRLVAFLARLRSN